MASSLVDRPKPVDPEWLKQVERIFGEYRLIAMTVTGERGLVCRIEIEPDSQGHLRKFSTEKAKSIKEVSSTNPSPSRGRLRGLLETSICNLIVTERISGSKNVHTEFCLSSLWAMIPDDISTLLRRDTNG
jgi:hypothetical protein